MNRKEEYEQEIDLKDLMFHVLYRWRSVLLVAALACALAAGHAELYNGRVLPDRRARVQTQLEEQERLLGALEGKAVDTAQKRLEELQAELDGLEGRSTVKDGAIGLVVGLFGMAFCYAVGYVLSDRMRGERELLDRYGYRLLGTFPRHRKGKPLQGLDRFLEEREGAPGPMGAEEVQGIIAVNISNLAPDGGLLLVTGTVDTGKLQELTKGIVPRLQKDVVLAAGADMNRTAGTLEALGKCGAVILVEERGASLRGRIQREHESIAALGKPVVGYVVL